MIYESNGKLVLGVGNFSITPRTIGGVSFNWIPVDLDPTEPVAGYVKGGSYITLPDNGTAVTSNIATTSPELQVPINFRHTGDYYLWVLGYSDTAGQSSVYWGYNGVASTSQMITFSSDATWNWQNGTGGTPAKITISNLGRNTFHLWMRHSGVAINRVIITNNPNFTPIADPLFWREQNIYQITTDRFENGNSLNDALTGGFSPKLGNKCHGGDLKGIERRLQYIKSLGATAIWISPFLRNGRTDFHGYAATDFYAVEPRMGTMRDLEDLVAAAHKEGMLVIADVVVNHGSDLINSSETSWPLYRVPPSRYRIKYNSKIRYAPPFNNEELSDELGMNVRLEQIFHDYGEIRTWSDGTQVNMGDLLVLDDLRTETSYIRSSMIAIWNYWKNTLDLDGFRVDTVKHVEMDFWNVWCPAIRNDAFIQGNPNFFIFGETYDGNDAVVGKYTGKNKTSIDKFDGMADFPLYFKINEMFGNPTSSLNLINDRYSALLNPANYDQSTVETMVTFIDNHDVARFMNQPNVTTQNLLLALAFLYTSKGVPSLYYGTEQSFSGGADPANREDMFHGEWRPGNAGNAVNSDNFNMTNPVYEAVADLIQARKDYSMLTIGEFVSLHVDLSGPGLFIYTRKSSTDEIIVMLNSSNTQKSTPQVNSIKLAGHIYRNIFNSADTLTVAGAPPKLPTTTVQAKSYKIYCSTPVIQPTPRVDTVTPTYSQLSVPTTGTNIVVTFTVPMNAAATQGAFSIIPWVGGSFSWSNSNKTMTFMPGGGFSPDQVYIVRIGSSAKESSGKQMAGNFETKFSTSASLYKNKPTVDSPILEEITTNSAKIGAYVLPSELNTSVTVRWGPNATIANSLPATNIGNSRFWTHTSHSLTGLSPNTSYFYRIDATNAMGLTQSELLYFITRSS